MAKKELNKEGKDQLAIAILLWKDFLSDGKMDIDVTKRAIELADHLGIKEEFQAMMPKLPPMKIEERYPR